MKTRGHPPKTINSYKNALKHFYHWFDYSRIKYQNIDANIINDFLYKHLPVCKCTKPVHKNLKTVRAALNLFYFSRTGQKKVSKSKSDCQISIKNEIIAFSSYLKDICGLSLNTCIYRIRYIRNFLLRIFAEKPFNVKSIRKIDFFHYISKYTRQCKSGTKNVIACSLRSYLKYLRFKGVVEPGFIKIVPSVANWKLSGIPRIFSDEQIRKLLNSFNKKTPEGLRDYAIALCMTDLGLRASEITRIELSDIDWHNSILYIKSTKSKRDRSLPISNRLGEAIVQYIKHGRLKTASENLFIRHTVPYGISLNTEQVRGAIRRAYARAGIPRSITGTHILRHTAASKMHQSGATIKQLADVLGHHSIDTTIFYTKINIPELKNIISPWPEVEK